MECINAVIELEALAMHWIVGQLKYCLWGQSFTIETEHALLQWLAHMKDTNPCLMYCYLALQTYWFTVQYHWASEHANAVFFPQQTIWASLEQQATWLCVCVCEPPGNPPTTPHACQTRQCHPAQVSDLHGTNGIALTA